MSEGSRPQYSPDGDWYWTGEEWTSVGEPQPVKRPPIWITACVAAAMALIVAAVMTVSVHLGGRSGLSLPQASASGMHGLRLCGGNGYDEASHLCISRLNAAPVAIKIVGCSVFVNGHVGQTIHSYLEYRGRTVYRGYAQIDDQSTNVGFSYALTPGDVLPGGRWSCGFTLDGSSRSASFDSSGPVGGFLYPATCDGSTLQSFGAGLACPSAQSSLADVRSAGCSAVLSGFRSSQISLVVAYGGGSVQPITKSYPINGASSLFVAGVELRPTDYGAQGTLPAGRYTCGWIVAGHLVGSTSFQVS